MDRALGFGPRGCGFESCQARHHPLGTSSQLDSVGIPFYRLIPSSPHSRSKYGFFAFLYVVNRMADVTLRENQRRVEGNGMSGMNEANRAIWLLGHRLSMLGLVDEA